MKKQILFAIALSCTCITAWAGKHSGLPKVESTKTETGTGAKAEHEHVDGYTKKDGTVVKSHERSTKDDTKDNNWSTKGNVNPDTGKTGTK